MIKVVFHNLYTYPQVKMDVWEFYITSAEARAALTWELKQ